MAELHYEFGDKTLQDIVNLFEDKEINLSPGFQRDSVWTERDRAKLIDSVIRNYPIPSIFLYRREANGKIIYDVIDGKQRIESFLMFCGFIRGKRFWAKVQLPEEDEKNWVNWSYLCRHKKQHLFTGYKINTIEVTADPAAVIDLFVRINSTGKALTGAEKRHAKFFNSDFLRAAGKLAARYENYFSDKKILSAGQISRMKHVELICELMLSIYQGQAINKKIALDRIMESKGFTANQTKIARDKTVRALNRVMRMFPKINQTRFHQVSDFYSLVMLLSKFENEKLILTDRRRNKLAWDLLVAFSTGVDLVREQQKKARGSKPEQESYREYLLTVLEATDEISHRQKREDILRGLLQNLFVKKDKDRFFSTEQRRILWHLSQVRKCSWCGKPVTWSDITIDHVNPWSASGRTSLKNAALMHRRCNAEKGNRRS